MTTTIRHVTRYYLENAPFGASERCKAAGLKWDRDTCAWWTEDKETASVVLDDLNAMPAEPDATGAPRHASFMRLPSGDWGVRCHGFVPELGETVDVTTRNGRVRRMVISTLEPEAQVHHGKTVQGSVCATRKTAKKKARAQAKPANPEPKPEPKPEPPVEPGSVAGGAFDF